jgi:hypothetical protein
MKKKRTTKIIVHKQYPIIKLKVHDLEEDYDRISRVLCVSMFFWGGSWVRTSAPGPGPKTTAQEDEKMRTTRKVYHRKHEKELPTPRLTKKHWQEQKKFRKYHCQPQDRKINSEKRNCQPRGTAAENPKRTAYPEDHLADRAREPSEKMRKFWKGRKNDMSKYINVRQDTS